MAPTTRSKRKRQQAELEKELRRCAQRGEFDRARELVEIERVNVNRANEYGYWRPLFITAQYNSVQVARLLLENDANVDAANNDGNTALTSAVFNHHVAVAEVLLEYGADVEKQFCYYGCMLSPLGWAISKTGMVALLLRFGANTEETLYNGITYTALCLACWKGNLEIVQLLLNHEDGVDISTISPRNCYRPAMSPLCKACERNNLEMVQLLVQHGARVIFDGVYPDVPCPLAHPVEKGSLELVRFLLDNSRFSETVENARLEEMDETVGVHPLSLPLETAIRWNKLKVAQLLVERGAHVNDRPFLWQCAKLGRRLEIVRLLLRVGANVNRVDDESGETPLWAATKNGDGQLVKEFLKAHADVRIRDKRGGETPLGVAYRRGHKGVVYLLLRTSPQVWSKLAEVL